MSLVVALSLFLVVGCASEPQVVEKIAEVEKIIEVEKAMEPVNIDTLKTEVVSNYADGVHAGYSRSLASARAMDLAMDAFLADPTPATLEAAKRAWLIARDDYGPTEAFRFYSCPIDNEEDSPEGLLNAWPMDESYVDYVEGDASAGIINMPDEYPQITAELIESLNEEGGEENVSTGWHAIEFLLWGQDLNANGLGPTFNAQSCSSCHTPTFDTLTPSRHTRFLTVFGMTTSGICEIVFQ